jgi:replication initiation and membrane attachment protein DnaB
MSEVVKELSAFYNAIANDCRIGATHISLYMALFQRWNQSGFETAVSFTSQELMIMAKISSRATYHKCLRDLVEFGYIKYIPSCNPFLKNIAYLKWNSEIDEIDFIKNSIV